MIAIVIIIFCILSYWWGGEMVRSSEIAYKQQALALVSEKSEMESKLTELKASMQSSQIRYEQLTEKYNTEVPTGKLKELTDLVSRQLKDGINSKRLAFVIESARPPKNCSQPITKRFVIKTPAYRGPDSYVVFGSGAITITGEGEAAKSNTGKAEAWYNPGKEVKIIFTQLGGAQSAEKIERLPIHYSMVIGDKEHRFTVAKGNRSFVKVTADYCDYP